MKVFAIVLALLSSLSSYSQGGPKSLQVTTSTYKATLLNTNFNLPIVRFNLNNSSNPDAKGQVALFNSLGAGISINRSEVRKITDTTTGEAVSSEMSNIIGIQLGFLFAASSSDGASTNIFAPTLSLSILDFQIGTGYEFGNVQNTNKRFFFTLAYGIPLQKLTNKGSFEFKPKNNQRQQQSQFLK